MNTKNKYDNRSQILDSYPGFEHINRFWDPANLMVMAKILPGEFYVTPHDEIITTVLGSCVSACIRDKSTKVGGMNHFMLPVSKQDLMSIKLSKDSSSNRYGNYAMEALINEIIKHGGKKNNLEVKLFGGGMILEKTTNIGLMNIEFVLDYVFQENLQLIGKDVGDIFPRKIIYYPSSGRVRVKRLRSLHNNTILNREKDYIKDLGNKPIGGEIELF